MVKAKQQIEKQVVFNWLLIVLYDLIIGIPNSWGLLIVLIIAWLATGFIGAQWGFESKQSPCLKVAVLALLASVMFVTSGLSIEIVSEVSPDYNGLNFHAVIVGLMVEGFAASVWTAAIVALPLAVVFQRNLFLVVLSISAPLLLFKLADLIVAQNAITGLIVVLETILMVLVVWCFAHNLGKVVAQIDLERSTAAPLVPAM
jgi:hypothetical protein